VLGDLLEAARSGRGGFVVVSGEPGIGKTRVAEELAAAARASGTDVAWGRCFEDDPSPFTPWIAVADHVIKRQTPDELRERLGHYASAVATLVPELDQVLVDLPEPASLRPEDARFRLYDAVARLVLPQPDAEPCLIVLDDLQWADAASLELLRHIARLAADAPVLILGAAREAEVRLDHPLAHALADVDRVAPLTRIRLAPLDDEATGLLLEHALGRPADREAIASVLRETRGNPFFTTELVRHLREEGYDFARAISGDAIPAGVRDAVGRRLSRLSPDTAQMLSVACAFAGTLELAELEAVTGLGEERLLAAIDEALAAAMLRPVGGDDYEFAHAIVRGTLYESLSPSRRVRLHRRVAQALEEAHTRDDERHAAEVADQYHRSRSLPGGEHGVPYALAAADSARGRHAYARAAELLRFAADLSVESAPSLRAEVLRMLAIAEAEALSIEGSRRTADEAVETMESTGADVEDMAAFLAEEAFALQDAGATDMLVRPLVERGVSMLGARRPLAWARLKLAERPLERFRVAGFVAGRWLGFEQEAVALARAQGGERDYARTVELMDWRPRAETDELHAIVLRWKDPAASIHGLSVVMRSLMHQHGAFHEGGEVARELLARSDRFGSLPGRAYALVYLALAWASTDQDLDQAQKLAEQAEDLVERLGEGHRLRFSARFLGQALIERGEPDWPELSRRRVEALVDPELPPWMTVLYVAFAARAYAAAGNEREARRLLDELVPAFDRLEPTTLNQNGAVTTAAWTAWLLGADEHAEELRRHTLSLIDAGVGDYPGTSRELAVAWMALLAGDAEEALEFVGRARDVLTAAGQRSLLGVVAETERRVRTAQPGSAGPDGLTRRELEILRALAAGRTNKEIAHELVLSVHTVERHVANAYRKIGAHNRAEATAYAVRRGL
jgi:DNA-binding NarL/FixJ family response regulator